MSLNSISIAVGLVSALFGAVSNVLVKFVMGFANARNYIAKNFAIISLLLISFAPFFSRYFNFGHQPCADCSARWWHCQFPLLQSLRDQRFRHCRHFSYPIATICTPSITLSQCWVNWIFCAKCDGRITHRAGRCCAELGSAEEW